MDKSEMYNRISDRLETIDLTIKQRMEVRKAIFEVLNFALDVEIINLKNELKSN